MVLQFKSKGYQAAECLSTTGKSSLLFSLGLYLATYIMESNLLYSEPTNFNAYFYPDHSDRIIQNNVPINIWALWPRQIDTKKLTFTALLS